MDDFDYNQSTTRERIAARRKRVNIPRGESGVMPGPRRTLAAWFASGRVISLPLLVLAAAGMFYVTANPRFRVRDVKVEGADLLRPAAVVQLSGAVGRSVWLVDTDQVAAGVRTSAYVEQASAYVTLPDRLTIVVRERRPEVRWRSGGQLYLLDGDGRVLGADSTAPLTGTLVIEDRSGRALQPNDRVDQDAIALGRELSLRLPAEYTLTPSAISWTLETGIVAEAPGGRTIVFGRSDNIERKLAILRSLLASGEKFRYLDLRPETPYYRNDDPGAAPTPAPSP